MSLAGGIGQKEAGQRLGKIRVVEEGSNVCRDIGADLFVGNSDIVHNFGTTIHYGDDVLEIVAREDVVVSTSMKRFELRRDQQRWRDDASAISWNVETLGGVDGHRIRAVAESQHARGRRHYVDDDMASVAPATERSSLRGVRG